jgi:hypothetical protein
MEITPQAWNEAILNVVGGPEPKERSGPEADPCSLRFTAEAVLR